MSNTILTSVLANGGRVSRYGDFTILRMHATAFAATPIELMQHQNWARGRISSGNANRDRTAFTDRFDTIVARSGSGLRTKGSRGLLQRIVKSMKANGLILSEWSIPHDLNDGVEIKKKPQPAPAAKPAA